MGSKHITTSVALVLSAVITSPALAQEAHSTSRSCSPVLGSQVCTWVVMEGGAAVELGVAFPIAVVEAVPSDPEMVWPPEQLATVLLPAEARTSLGIDHLGINWEAHGHPPGPFLTPHFDFHFYNLSPSEVRAIDCSDNTKPPRLPAQHTLPDIDVPELGVLVGLCVPRMGMHAMAQEEPEATDPFQASAMVGYYGGEAIFFEPMISLRRLLQKSDFALAVPAIENLPEGVHYPSEFRAEYDVAGKQYRMVFTGFHSN